MKTAHTNLYKKTYSKKSIHLAWGYVVVWMIVIFWFSAQHSVNSGNMSGGITGLIINVAKLLSIDAIANAELETIHFFVRKLAHFGVYFILGMLVLNALHTGKLEGKNAIIISFIICCGYAITDEIHQIFVPGRAGQIRDVLIDNSGSLCGILFFSIIGRLRGKFRRKIPNS